MKTLRGVILLAALVMPWTGFAQTTTQSHIADQDSVTVTVYNNNRGLVRDVRSIQLPAGSGELRFMDVAAHILPVTVRARSLARNGGFTIVEQNYEYDLMDANRLLDKYVGKEIRIIDPECNDRERTCGAVNALLLSNNRGQVFRIDGKVYLGYPGIRVLPKLPEELIATPTLTWKYRNRQTKPQLIEVTYLTGEMNWKADYVLALNKTDTLADLSGWVTIENRSGSTYIQAALKLVAGNPNRVTPRKRAVAYGLEETAVAAAPPAFSESALFEYHVYNLQGQTDLKNKQTKQIKLLDASPVKIEKKLQVHGGAHFARRSHGRTPNRIPVAVYIRFSNTAGNKLGRPLPAGIVRLYKADTDGSVQFIGEDRVAHTPKKETLNLRAGEAFDVVAERVQTDYRKLSPQQHESAWKISFKNHKPEDIVVEVVETLPANGRIVKSSHPYEKKDAFTVQFSIPVARDGEAVCTYRVRTGG